MTAQFSDRWARWLLQGRYGGDEEALRRSFEFLAPIRDRVLSGAAITPGEVVLDVGCGDGLIGFGAVPLVGETGTVVFADISEQLLERCRQTASELGVSERCRFLMSPAETLDGVEDASVDVVTTRSVLIYVDDKDAAFSAFRRVLKPGGRISLFEPINRRSTAHNGDTLFGFNVSSIAELAVKVRAVFEAAAPSDGPMMGFDETDLLRLSESMGFSDIKVTLELSSTQESPYALVSWTQLMQMSPNPNAPTIGEAIQQALDAEEAERLELYLRPLMEQKAHGRNRAALAYLTATRPTS